MYTSIVVGSDGSETAEIALTKAIQIASLSGAKLHVVSAYSPTPSHVAGAAPMAEAYQYAGSTGSGPLSDQCIAANDMFSRR